MANRITLIGSHAMCYYFDDFTRAPKDLDYLAEEELLTKEVEYLVIPPLNKYLDCQVLPVDILLTLKMSHLFWDINWAKHMFDVQFLLGRGVLYKRKLLDELVEYWKSKGYHQKKSNLTLTSEEFFTNSLKWNHDRLHELLNPNPRYKAILVGDGTVNISEEKFNSLSYEEQIATVQEEVYVMAFERSNQDYRTSYIQMLNKFIIAHAPYWLGIWMIVNYLPLRQIFNYRQFMQNKIIELVALNDYSYLK
jgi:hypothetical protein